MCSIITSKSQDFCLENIVATQLNLKRIVEVNLESSAQVRQQLKLEKDRKELIRLGEFFRRSAQVRLPSLYWKSKDHGKAAVGFWE